MGMPAPFWRRYAAYSLDLAIVGLLALPLLAWRLHAVPAALEAAIVALQARIAELLEASLDAAITLPELARLLATDAALGVGIVDLAAILTRTLLLAAAIVTAVAALWFIGFEASARQATPGKRSLGLRVTDIEGRRPSPARVALRFVAGAPSWILLHLGHAMAAWTKDRRALHDLVAGTRVELAAGTAPALPAWARSWLLLQVAAFFGLAGFVLLRYVRLLLEASGGGLG